MQAKAQPYRRDAVSADLFVKPDVVTARSCTVCWHGVVSPVVCTLAPGSAGNQRTLHHSPGVLTRGRQP